MRSLAALLVILAAGCWHGQAAVVAAHVAGGDASADSDLQGASGTLDCPGDLTPQDLGSSDEDGDLRAQHMGAISLSCAMNVSKAGYRPYKAFLQDVCSALDSGRCQNVDVRIVLIPEPGKSQGGSK